MPGARPEGNHSRDGWLSAKAGGITALGGTRCPTKVPGEGTNPCTQPSFATNNVVHVLQDLSESIRGSTGTQLGAADGPIEPIYHNLHESLIELFERPEILSLHAVRQLGPERQLHLKIPALCVEAERVFNVLVDTGSRVSLVKAACFRQSVLPQVWEPSG